MACDNTTQDPTLADTCISIAHGPLPEWWLSPAITLNGAASGAVANPPPAVNVIDVTFHRAGTDCTLPSGTSAILVDLYVCMAGLAMNALDTTHVKKIVPTLPSTNPAIIPLSQATAGADRSLSSVNKTIQWIAGTNPSLPDGPGHKCLVAIAYPDTSQLDTVDPGCFHQAGGPGQADQHYAQLNIAIEPIFEGRRWAFATFTNNLDSKNAAPATLRVEADLDPNPRVIDILTPALDATPGYKRVSRLVPQRFANPIARLSQCGHP